MKIDKDYLVTSSLQEMAEKLIKHSDTKGVIGHTQTTHLNGKVDSIIEKFGSELAHVGLKRNGSMLHLEFKNGSKLFFIEVRFRSHMAIDGFGHEVITPTPETIDMAGHNFDFMDRNLVSYGGYLVHLKGLFTLEHQASNEKIQS